MNRVLDQSAIPRSLSGLRARLDATRSGRDEAEGSGGCRLIELSYSKMKKQIKAGDIWGCCSGINRRKQESGAGGSLMQLGGDVRGQAHKSFLLLLCILSKYA